MYRLARLLTIILLISTASDSQGQSRAQKQTIQQLKHDVGYLASDELEGRATGSAGEKKAGDYIIERYRQKKITPYQSDYRYPFTFIKGKEIGNNTQIRVGNKSLRVPEEAFPLPYSANRKISQTVLPDIKEQGNIWLVPLYQNETEANDPHFDWEKYAFEQSREAARLGAKGIVFYDAYQSKYPAAFNSKNENEQLDIPAAVILSNAWQNSDVNSGTQSGVVLDLNITVKKTEATGDNIIGFIDNQAKYTVVIGGHYDHLGYGLDGSSLHKGERLIHNGADDNASGTALLLHLASQIHRSKLRNYNYMFIHFSGEELGLLGSKAIVKELKLDSTNIAYMINLDMVGRLNDSSKALTVGGVGTSPAWYPFVNQDKGFQIRVDSSGMGPSDHSSFYQTGIPVLFFFTGTHKDYHKPSDDAHLLNYKGMADIGEFIMDIVTQMDKQPKPVFTPTKQQSTGRTRFKVTLGIIPDYSYQEGGVKVDGVSENKPAAAAGLQTGDIIIQMGDIEVKSMQSYMEALGSFNPGDETIVVVRRGEEQIKLNLVFTKP